MTVQYTANFRFGIPDFLSDPWHEDFEALVQSIDRVLYQMAIAESVSIWENSTAYVISDLVIDSITGIMYTCGVAHTSPVTPTTFAADRVTNPSRWNPTANLPQQRGTWVTGTTYVQGDFVVDSDRYAVCLVGHVAGVFNTDLAAGKWSVLIDLSNLGVGINAEAEGSIAAAATTEIGDETPSRLLITGAATINDFGNVANQYKILRYAGICTITNSPIIDIPGALDRTTDAGGIQFLSSDSTGAWRELFYTRGDGSPLGVADSSETVKGIIETATVAEVQAGVDTSRAATSAGVAAAIADATTSILNTIRAGVGSSLDTLAEIATAIGLLAPKASPTFTGTAVFDDATVADDLIVKDLIVTDTAALPAGSVSDTELAEPGCLKKIGTLTAAASASLDFTAALHAAMFDSTYDEIEIHLVELVPTTNAHSFQIRVGTGAGPTFQTGNNYDYAIQGTQANGTGLAVAAQNTNSALLNGAALSNGNPVNGVIHFTKLNAGTYRVTFRGSITGVNSAGVFFGDEFWCDYSVAVVVTGIQILASNGTGTIASGKAVAYGIKK